MTNKEITLKLALIYEKLLNLDNLIYLEFEQPRDCTLENIKADVFELWNYYRTKKNIVKKPKQVTIQQSKH